MGGRLMNYSLASRQYATPFFQYVKGYTQVTSTTSLNLSSDAMFTADRGSQVNSFKAIHHILLGGAGGGGEADNADQSGGGGGGAGGFLQTTSITLCGGSIGGTTLNIGAGGAGTGSNPGNATGWYSFSPVGQFNAGGGGNGGTHSNFNAGYGGPGKNNIFSSGSPLNYSFVSAGIGCGGGGAAPAATIYNDRDGGFGFTNGGAASGVNVFSGSGTSVFGGAGGGGGLGGRGGLGYYLSGSTLNIGGSGGPGLSAVFDGVNLVAIGGGGGGANGFGSNIYYPTSTQVLAGSGTDGGGRGAKIWRSNSDLFVLSATPGAANRGAGGGGGGYFTGAEAGAGGSGRAAWAESIYVIPTRPLPTYKNKKAIYPYYAGGSYIVPS